MWRALILLFVATSAAAQLTIDVTRDREFIYPGTRIVFTVVVRNPGTAPATSTYSGRISLSTAAGAIIRGVTIDHRDITCRRLGIIGSNEVYDCSCTTPTITVPPGGEVKTTVTVDVPANATPGATLTFTASLTWGSSGSISRTMQLVIRTDPGPRLSLKIIRLPSPVNYHLVYEFEVTNVGDMPTAGPIDVDVVIRGPAGLDSNPVPDENWAPAGSVLRSRFQTVLQPGQSLRTTGLHLFINPVRAATYQVTALAAGGGSPPDEKKETYVVDSLKIELVRSEDPLDVIGRPR